MKPSDVQRHRIVATLELQFPNLNPRSILQGIDIETSRKTGRIRYVYNDGELLFSLRTSDGHFIPTFHGAKQILETGYKGLEVVVNDDAAPYVAAGKTSFCKHITSVSDDILPNTEVFVKDRNKKLLATGTAAQPAYALLELTHGIGVQIRNARDKQ